MIVETSVDVGTMGEEVEAFAVPEKHNEESIDNIKKYSVDVGTMYEKEEASAVTDQQNE